MTTIRAYWKRHGRERSTWRLRASWPLLISQQTPTAMPPSSPSQRAVSTSSFSCRPPQTRQPQNT
ncbi:hypothetical protein B0T26DRAFT_724839 [Lasiosphaeria miniovina]|uniref:Uncharacterized protein n=1 Tax=Lasiosphaeria miniovina TaxID=1954250 RepID=A0AA39ZYC7_9PEZI|nr:uncharacterized protein B0T26DRAFT_724839 [Lasiosphaeria miniovina]KAK0705893.1 hypothetical protein B0T26DRAFT_724839 [Lasiosphaeria miniovina]